MRLATRINSLVVSVTIATAAASLTTSASAGEFGRNKAVSRDLSPHAICSDCAGTASVSIRSLSGPKVDVGHPVAFEISSNRDGYIQLYVMSASGRVQLWMENVPVKAGELLRYPRDGLAITATAPTGKDRLVLLLTRHRIDGFSGMETTRLPHDLDLSKEDLRTEVETMMSAYPRSDWTWAKTSVEVVNR